MQNAHHYSLTRQLVAVFPYIVSRYKIELIERR